MLTIWVSYDPHEYYDNHCAHVWGVVMNSQCLSSHSIIFFNSLAELSGADGDHIWHSQKTFREKKRWVMWSRSQTFYTTLLQKFFKFVTHKSSATVYYQKCCQVTELSALTFRSSCLICCLCTKCCLLAGKTTFGKLTTGNLRAFTSCLGTKCILLIDWNLSKVTFNIYPSPPYMSSIALPW